MANTPNPAADFESATRAETKSRPANVDALYDAVIAYLKTTKGDSGDIAEQVTRRAEREDARFAAELHNVARAVFEASRTDYKKKNRIPAAQKAAVAEGNKTHDQAHPVDSFMKSFIAIAKEQMALPPQVGFSPK